MTTQPTSIQTDRIDLSGGAYITPGVFRQQEDDGFTENVWDIRGPEGKNLGVVTLLSEPPKPPGKNASDHERSIYATHIRWLTSAGRDELSSQRDRAAETTVQDRGVLQETVVPGISKGVLTGLPGVFADLGSLALQPASLTPKARARIQKPFLGSEHITELWTELRDVAREGRHSAQEWLSDRPELGPVKTAAEGLLQAFRALEIPGYDLTPDESTKTRKYLSMAAQFFGEAPVEGIAVAKFAAKLAQSTPRGETLTRDYVLKELQNSGLVTAGGLPLDPIEAAGALRTAPASYQRTPARSSMQEAYLGTAAGLGLVYGEQLVNDAYPEGDAPAWLKAAASSTGAISFPFIAAAGPSVLKGVVSDTVKKIPYARAIGDLTKGILEQTTLDGAEKAALRATTMTGGGKARSGLDLRGRGDETPLAAGVPERAATGTIETFRLAMAMGRNMDPATRILYTSPQLALNEALHLQGALDKLVYDTSRTGQDPNEVLRNREDRVVIGEEVLLGNNDSAFPPSLRSVEDVENRISDLKSFHQYQEGQLRTLFEGTGTSADVALDAQQAYSDRLLSRRDLVFNALNKLLFDSDLGGQSHEGVDPQKIADDWASGKGSAEWTYDINRQRAAALGLSTVGGEYTKAVQNAADNYIDTVGRAVEQSLRDAEDQVSALRDLVPEKGMTAEERKFHATWIRKTYQKAYDEIDFYEDLLWNGIPGFATRKTEDYISPDGDNLGPQFLIDGVPVGDHFAQQVANLDRGDHVNQPAVLYQLAGRASLREQAAKKAVDPERLKINQDALKNSQESLRLAQNKADERTTQTTKARESLDSARKALETLTQQQADLPPVDDAVNKAAQESLAEAQKLVDRLGKDFNEASVASENANVAVRKAKTAVDRAALSLDTLITKDVTDVTDQPVNLEGTLLDESLLGVTVDDSGALRGQSAKSVHNVISNIKRELSAERNKPTRNNKKMAVFVGLIQDLQRGMGQQDNFGFGENLPHYAAAQNMTFLKRDMENNLSGRILGYKGKPLGDEELLTAVVPGRSRSHRQQDDLTQVIRALTPITVGEGTPWKTERHSYYFIDVDGGVQFDPNFPMEKYSSGPPPPFEAVEGTGRFQGFRVKEGTEPTRDIIDLVKTTLWNRFYDTAGRSPKTGFNATVANKFLNENKEAIDWLQKHSGPEEFTGFSDIVEAEELISYLKSASANNLDETVSQMRSRGAFEGDLTEDAFRELVSLADEKTNAVLKAAYLFSGPDGPDPLKLGTNFLKSYEANKNSADYLRDTLKVLEKGVEEDGTNPALDGFKIAVGEALIGRLLADTVGSTRAAAEGQRLGVERGIPGQVRFWDAQRFTGQNEETYRLLSTLYGEDAPKLFDDIGKGVQSQLWYKENAKKGVPVQEFVSKELAGNIGRFMGAFVGGGMGIPGFGKLTPSPLTMAGVGRRYAINTLADWRGTAVQRLILDFLMDPDMLLRAVSNQEQVLSRSATSRADANFAERFALRMQDLLLNIPAEQLKKRVGTSPGTGVSIATPPEEQEEQKEDNRGAAVSPTRIPTASVQRPVVQDSVLSLADPLNMPRSQPPSPSPQTLARLEQMGMPLFARHGGLITGGAGSGVGRMEESGIMAIQKKPRQLVG